jgi:protein-S-isoprenylcysteine O-methyltransferase Ste14
MKNYIKYLKNNPNKMILVNAVLAFCLGINLAVNITFTSLGLSIGVALFTTLVSSLILLQVWGEYKLIEGFWPTVKEFFGWK